MKVPGGSSRQYPEGSQVDPLVDLRIEGFFSPAICRFGSFPQAFNFAGGCDFQSLKISRLFNYGLISLDIEAAFHADLPTQYCPGSISPAFLYTFQGQLLRCSKEPLSVTQIATEASSFGPRNNVALSWRSPPNPYWLQVIRCSTKINVFSFALQYVWMAVSCFLISC